MEINDTEEIHDAPRGGNLKEGSCDETDQREQPIKKNHGIVATAQIAIQIIRNSKFKTLQLFDRRGKNQM